jgi:hypothetical protein
VLRSLMRNQMGHHSELDESSFATRQSHCLACFLAQRRGAASIGTLERIPRTRISSALL